MAPRAAAAAASGKARQMTAAKAGAPPPTKAPAPPPLPAGPASRFGRREAYARVAAEFHRFHRHDLNAAAHLATTALGVWGALQLALRCGHGGAAVAVLYAVAVLWTTPLPTAVAHSALVYGLLHLSPERVGELLLVGVKSLHGLVPDNVGVPLLLPLLPSSAALEALGPLHVCLGAIVLGYGLQDLSHYLACEPTYMNSYLAAGQPWMLLVHTFWLLPLVIDAVLLRRLFLPKLLVSRNRTLFVPSVAARSAVQELRTWIRTYVKESRETTHLWPHQHAGTDGAVTALEQDENIHAAFRQIFSAEHFDVAPVVPMNEIYVTAVGPKSDINSDAVFYTPHTDGPYWWLPGCSLYRVLVGVTRNRLVRTRFNLQHGPTCDRTLDLYGVLGFDYNRELHWIDHVPGVGANAERRALVKLHYVVYPHGWHRYGRLAAHLNATYNTWARGNFLRTLRPDGAGATVLAWWIWLTTWCNALLEEYVGWSNLTYVGLAYALAPPMAFLVLTSFRHYAVYIATFASRDPPVAHGCLMRDAKLYKTLSMLHLARRLGPLVQLPRDGAALLLAGLGFATTLAATARLGMVRTYFGSELGLVAPKWIRGFPYGYIPHPMINGQIFGFAVILYWFWGELSRPNAALLIAHMTCYAVHMAQEIFS